jgi:group I intron endonuclease
MFIYKITVKPLNQIYIGLDTKPSYKLSRWKQHCAESASNCKTKLHKAMNKFGVENCTIEIVEDNFLSLGDLALAEIEYIKKFNSFKAGLNSTPGGDGLGKHNLQNLTDEEILKIKLALGENFRNYNKNIKWANTSEEDRKKLTKHLNTPDVIKSRTETLRKFYEHNPDAKKYKGLKIKVWQKQNQEQLKKQNKINSLKGAAKVSKRLKVELETGEVLYYSSKSDFQRKTGQWAKTVLEKTKIGLFHNGYKAWEE